MHPDEDSELQPSGQVVVVDVDGLPALFDALRGRGDPCISCATHFLDLTVDRA